MPQDGINYFDMETLGHKFDFEIVAALEIYEKPGRKTLYLHPLTSSLGEKLRKV